MKRSFAMIIGLLQATLATAVCLDTKDDLHACRYSAGDIWCVEHNRPPFAYADECVKRYGKPGDSTVGWGASASGIPTRPVPLAKDVPKDRATDILKPASQLALTNTDQRFLQAAQDGDLKEVRSLLAAGANVNARDENYMSAMTLASWRGHTEVVRTLLAADADIDQFAPVVAIKFDHMELYEILKQALEAKRLSIGANNPRDVNQQLRSAAQNGDLSTVESLLASGADVNAKERNGGEWTALMLSAQKDHAHVVQSLLAAGANINERNGVGSTALSIASTFGRLNMVRLLISAGADVNTKGIFGETALMSAAREGHIDVVSELVAAGADVNAKRIDDGSTALSEAIDGGLTKIVPILMQAEKQNSKTTKGGFSARVPEVSEAVRESRIDESGWYMISPDGKSCVSSSPSSIKNFLNLSGVTRHTEQVARDQDGQIIVVNMKGVYPDGEPFSFYNLRSRAFCEQVLRTMNE